MKVDHKFNRTTIACAACCLALLPTMGHAKKGNPTVRPFQRQQPVDPSGVTLIANADNRFGFRLFDEILKKEANTNLCISPTSIALALQMTYNGAQGTTQAGMEQTLSLQGMSLEEVNQSNRVLLAGLAAISKPVGNAAAPTSAPPQLDIANSLWLRNRANIRPDFIQRAQQFYHAQVDDLHDAPRSINAWVDQHTNHKIPQIVTASDVAGIEAALVNAVYFKGAWQIPFDAKATADKPFHPAQGTAQKCKMMRVSDKFSCAQTPQFQMVSLPYTGNRLEMLLLLPASGTSLNKIVSEATPENWQKWTTSLHVQPGTVELPRFRAEFGTELKAPLAALGMGEAFNLRAANFSGMTRGRLYISKVIHKTFVDVNEQGTEAAAATAVLMTKGIAVQPAPIPYPL